MSKILIGCTASVATIKLPLLIQKITETFGDDTKTRVILTENAKHFIRPEDLSESVEIHSDSDEWDAWNKRGDPVLHIELGKWADVFLIAPLDANTLAKISNGLCDNLLTCIARAWDLNKPLVFCPAMNTRMYEHPLTARQISQLEAFGYHHVPVVEKRLMCGDVGAGAMAEVPDIVHFLHNLFLYKRLLD